jgi:hypothetical protein
MDRQINFVPREYSKMHFSIIEIQNFLDAKNKEEKNVQKYENDLLLFGYLLGKSSHYHFKHIKLDDFLTYIWDKIIYINYLYSKKIINYRQKLSLSQIMIESQVDKINSNLDKEINQINGNSPLRVNIVILNISLIFLSLTNLGHCGK